MSHVQEILAIIILTFVILICNTHVVVSQKDFWGAEVYSFPEETYGRFNVRMKMVKGSGMLSTFFLYKNGSEQAGTFWEEIDIEVLGKDNANLLHTNIISDGVSGPLNVAEETIDVGFSLAEGFHVYTLEWTPDYISWQIDGVQYRRDTSSIVQDIVGPLTYRFNTWISCDTNWVGPIDSNSLDQFQYVDYLEYYSYQSGSFIFQWKENFNDFDSTTWGKADWTFNCNEVDFKPCNINVFRGLLLLALTKIPEANQVRNDPPYSEE